MYALFFDFLIKIHFYMYFFTSHSYISALRTRAALPGEMLVEF